MLDDLGRLKQEMDQLAALSDPPTASPSKALPSSKRSTPPHRTRETNSQSPRTRVSAALSSAGAVSPRSSAISHAHAVSTPSNTPPSSLAPRVLQLPEPDDIVVPAPFSSAPAAAASPSTATSPSKIARISPPAIGSPSEVYVEISRLVAEAYRAVSPRLAQHPPPPAGGNSHVIISPPTPPSLHPASPPLKSASVAAAGGSSHRMSPATPKSFSLSGGMRPRPTLRESGGS